MRMVSVSMPLSTTQALKGDRLMPALRITGTNLPLMSSSGAHKAPAMTRPCPSRYLVPLCMMMSAPIVTGRCSAGLQKQLSTASNAPALCAMSASARMSQTSVSGLVGLSANSSLVLGCTAAFHAATSVCGTKVVCTPNLPKSWNSLMVEPKVLCEHTTWSPDLSRPMMIMVMAAMPLLVPMQPVVPSRAARRRSIMVTVGLLKRL